MINIHPIKSFFDLSFVTFFFSQQFLASISFFNLSDSMIAMDLSFDSVVIGIEHGELSDQNIFDIGFSWCAVEFTLF